MGKRFILSGIHVISKKEGCGEDEGEMVANTS